MHPIVSEREESKCMRRRLNRQGADNSESMDMTCQPKNLKALENRRNAEEILRKLQLQLKIVWFHAAHSATVFQRLGAQYFHLTFSVHATRPKKLPSRHRSSSPRIAGSQSA